MTKFLEECSNKVVSLHSMVSPYFWVNPMQTAICGTPESKESTARVLCISRQVECITRVEQCGLLRFCCTIGGSLQRVLSGVNRVGSIHIHKEVLKTIMTKTIMKKKQEIAIEGRKSIISPKCPLFLPFTCVTFINMIFTCNVHAVYIIFSYYCYF